VKLRILPDDEAARYAEAAAVYPLAEQWRLRLVKACRHEWEIELEDPDDGAGVHLYCVLCPAGIDDLYPDGQDLMCSDGHIDETRTWKVEAGVHDSPVPLVLPVEVEVWSRRISNPIVGEDWDAGVLLHARGPARPLPDDNPPGGAE
jgi:hypothetical protein